MNVHSLPMAEDRHARIPLSVLLVGAAMTACALGMLLEILFGDDDRVFVLTLVGLLSGGTYFLVRAVLFRMKALLDAYAMGYRHGRADHLSTSLGFSVPTPSRPAEGRRFSDE